jgi:hypothetical protein
MVSKAAAVALERRLLCRCGSGRSARPGGAPVKITTLGALALGMLLLASPAATSAGASACLPPGVTADVLGWHTENAQTVALKTESGEPRAALIERFRSGDGRTAILVWVRGQVVYADTAPDDPRSPGWVDVGLMSTNGQTLLDTPGEACRWRVLGGVES